MKNIDRRTFTRTAAGIAASAIASSTLPLSRARESGPGHWKKAFMLGNVTKGPALPAFQLLKDAGFEGVELISPNQLDQKEVLAARDKTGLIIHGVSGGRHWQDPLSDPDPKVVERGMTAIRQEFLDCKAYGGTTVLVVPAVVNKKVSYRDAYSRSQANIRKLIPYAEQAGIKIAIEEVWNKFLLSPVEFARYIDEFESPWVAPISMWATSSSLATRKSGFMSWASESSRFTSRNMPSPNDSTTSSARARSTGRPCARPSSTWATRAGSRPKSDSETWQR